MKLAIPAVLLVLPILAGGPAAAQNSWSLRGPALGAQVGIARIAVDEGVTQTGFSWGAALRYGFTEQIALNLDVARAGILDEGNLDQADATLRYAFAAAGGRLRPFVEGGVGWRDWSWKEEGERLFWKDDYERSGAMFSGGAGAVWFINRSASLDALARFSAGTLSATRNASTDTRVGERQSAQLLQLRFGLSWRRVGGAPDTPAGPDSVPPPPPPPAP